MSNKQRICQPEITYHVVSRCVQGKDLMDSDYWKEQLEIIVNKAMEKYNFQCNHVAILDNHFHFMIYTTREGGNISRIMQYVKSRFAMLYNRINKRIGPFWNERFTDKIVEFQEDPLRYLLWLICYIGLNPVKKGLCSEPGHYRFGGLGLYTGEKPETKIKLTRSKWFTSSMVEYLKTLLRSIMCSMQVMPC